MNGIKLSANLIATAVRIIEIQSTRCSCWARYAVSPVNWTTVEERLPRSIVETVEVKILKSHVKRFLMTIGKVTVRRVKRRTL